MYVMLQLDLESLRSNSSYILQKSNTGVAGHCCSDQPASRSLGIRNTERSGKDQVRVEALQTLKCTNCGASLRQPSGSEFVACEYCGYSQRLTDVSRYMETLKTDVFNWVRSMVPTGIQMGTQTTDPIARSNLFEHVAKP